MSFQDIRDQEVPVRVLTRMLEADRIPNGLLFWGPAGTGKRMTALELAKAINCTQAKADACGTCLPCRKVKNGNHPDVRTVIPMRRARIIDVDTIETINEFASLRAFESKWRVFIILDADRMNAAAQNHLLKTLEEPPGRSLFILVTEFPKLLLPTIRSRCQLLRFGALRPETVIEILQRERGLEPAVAAPIAALAQGQMSRAFDLVDSDRRAALLDLIARLNAGEDPVALASEFTRYLAQTRERIAESIKAELDESINEETTREDRERIREEEKARIDAESRRDMMEYLYLLEMWYRDVAVYQRTGAMDRIMNVDQEASLAKARTIDLEAKIAAIEKTRLYLERFLNEERVFRDLFFSLAS